jgi:hypothetical protein
VMFKILGKAAIAAAPAPTNPNPPPQV